MQACHERTDHRLPIQVASLDTLRNRAILPAGVVIVDEAHRLNKFLFGWMAKPEWQSVPFIGLSATPWARGLGKFWDDLIIATTTQELIDQGYLSPFRVFAPSSPDLAGVATVAGDYHQGQLGEAVDKEPLIADIVRTWKQLGENRSTICFAVNRAHAQHIEKEFAAAGVTTGYVDAFTKPEEWARVRDRFADGTIRVVCNVGVLTTGVDWDVRCIILARPTRSEMLFVQMIGRGLRMADAKEDCLILDHSDTHKNLGFVTDIHHDVLDAGRERKPAIKREVSPVKECGACSFVMSRKTKVCPSCGFEAVAQHGVDHEDGELVQIAGKKRKPTMAEKEQFFAELRWVAQERGYKPGWAARQYRERYGVWPVSTPLARPALAETLSWVRSQAIRYAKSREAGRARAA